MITPRRYVKDALEQPAASNGEPPARLIAEIEALGQRMATVRDRIGRIIFGQNEVIDETLITLLAGGHVLLIGFPGLGIRRGVVLRRGFG